MKPVLCPIHGGEGQVLEWALIELQGKIEHVGEGRDADSPELGHLQAVQGHDDVVRLTVGYHQLEGKRLQLKKPFAILQKEEAQGAGQGGTPLAPHGEAGGEGGGSSACVSYQVIGVIRSKYLFKTRPTALISKPAGSRH